MKKRFAKKNAVVVAVALGAILILGGLFFNKQRQDSFVKETDSFSILNAQKIVTDIVSADSDNDGLKDWEELLLKTDPKNPDTDGDGTSDGEEVTLGRDPLIPGPNDIVEESELAAQTKNISFPEGTTETEKLALELFAGYINLKQGKNLSAENSENLIATIVSANTKVDKIKNYTAGDINIIEAPEREDIEKYGSELTKILKPNFARENDVVVLKRILEVNNIEDFALLDESIQYYQETVAGMLTLSVPEPISSEHIIAVNALARVIENVESMRQAFSNPVGVLISIGEYMDNELAFIQNLGLIGEYLKLNKAE